MNIERDRGLEWDAEGTLNNVTRWISGHDEGIAEWLKNVRRAHQWRKGLYVRIVRWRYAHTGRS